MQYREVIGYKSPASVRVKVENIAYHPFHLHEDALELLCVLEGCPQIWDSAARYTLSAGSVHIFNPNDAHKIQSEEDNLLLTVHLSRSYYQKAFPGLEDDYFISDTQDGQESTSSEMRRLRFLLARIAVEYMGSCSALTLEQFTCDLIAFLKEQFSDYIYGTDGKQAANIVRLQEASAGITPGGLRQNYERIYRIADYVEEHFSEKLQLGELARRERVNEAYLSRYIRRNLGMTFSQFVSLIRCEEASRLLASTDQTVDQIASSSGFSDRKELARHFRRWYQHTPAEYRREIRRDLTSGISIQSVPGNGPRVAEILDLYLDCY